MYVYIDLWLGSYEEWQNSNSYINYNKWLENEYGIKNIHGSMKAKFVIVNESKFTLFQLKYPECIKKILYE